MVVSSVMVVTVAKASAELWQKAACLTEQLSGSELLDLIFCVPIEQLGRLAFCLWTFFCLPPSPDSYFYYYYYDDDEDRSDRDTSSDSSSAYYHRGGYDSHSD